jgi:hypothetical protein
LKYAGRIAVWEAFWEMWPEKTPFHIPHSDGKTALLKAEWGSRVEML